MTNKKRLAAIVFAAVVLFALMISLFVITCEADHDCAGENCLVCAVIELCRKTLETFGGVPASAGIAFAYSLFITQAVSVLRIVTCSGTPVSLKVRLLN